MRVLERNDYILLALIGLSVLAGLIALISAAMVARAEWKDRRKATQEMGRTAAIR